MTEAETVFHLADLFHILPLQLEWASEGALSYATVLKDYASAPAKKDARNGLIRCFPSRRRKSHHDPSLRVIVQTGLSPATRSARAN